MKPGWFFGLLKLMNKLKLINGIFKFVKYYIGDAEVRRLLYTQDNFKKAKTKHKQDKKSNQGK